MLSCCIVGLVTGNYLELGTHGTVLQGRGSSGRFQLRQRSIEDNFILLPRMCILRCGTSEADWRKSAFLTYSEAQTKAGESAEVQGKTDNSDQRVEMTGRGPAFISASTAERSDHRNVAPGETKTVKANHHTLIMAGGQAMGSPLQGMAQQSVSDHPLRASAQGKVAIGEL